MEKYTELKRILVELGRVAVAFSSGVDSTFLLKVAVDTLGIENVIAVTATSCWFPQRELEEALCFCKGLGVTQVLVEAKEEEIPGFMENPTNRCYLCKKAIFEKVIEVAKEHQMKAVVEGSNMDDNGDYRPGHIAIKELGIKSPLREAELTKAEIRKLSQNLELMTFDKPSFACLASRFPYGENITEEKLIMVDKAEQLLLDMGFKQFRVRIHGEKDFLARIEVLPQDIDRLAAKECRERIYDAFKGYGFTYIALDLLGYRTGSMNETLAI